MTVFFVSLKLGVQDGKLNKQKGDTMYTYTINISRKYQRSLRDHGYSHYFRIETDMIKDELKGLTSELSLIYPNPDYKITVYRNISTSQEVEI